MAGCSIDLKFHELKEKKINPQKTVPQTENKV